MRKKAKDSPIFRGSGRVVLLVTLSWLLLLPGCASRSREVPSASAVDKRLTLTSYIEEGKLLALIVGTRPTRTRSEAAYIPLEVAVVNRGLRNLTLTLESFVLVDEDGARYPAVGHEELTRSYDGSIDFDRRLMELAPVIRGRHVGYVEIPGTLTPSVDQPIRRDIFLPRFSFASELIYFPRPTTGVRGHIFELFMKSRELKDPVFVRFKVSGAPKKK